MALKMVVMMAKKMAGYWGVVMVLNLVKHLVLHLGSGREARMEEKMEIEMVIQMVQNLENWRDHQRA